MKQKTQFIFLFILIGLNSFSQGVNVTWGKKNATEEETTTKQVIGETKDFIYLLKQRVKGMGRFLEKYKKSDKTLVYSKLLMYKNDVYPYMGMENQIYMINGKIIITNEKENEVYGYLVDDETAKLSDPKLLITIERKKADKKSESFFYMDEDLSAIGLVFFTSISEDKKNILIIPNRVVANKLSYGIVDDALNTTNYELEYNLREGESFYKFVLGTENIYGLTRLLRSKEEWIAPKGQDKIKT